jgi:hypothetical protein
VMEYLAVECSGTVDFKLSVSTAQVCTHPAKNCSRSKLSKVASRN